MNKKNLSMAIIFVLLFTLFLYPTLLCATFVTVAIIYIPSIIMYKVIKYCNMWTKLKINTIHRNVEIKLRSQKKKLSKIVITDGEACI